MSEDNRKLKNMLGPWSFIRPEGSNGWYDVRNRHGINVATCYNYEEAEHHARLIAAAPDMLEALIRIWNYFSEYVADDFESVILLDVQKSIERTTGLSIDEIMDNEVTP
jgi:hypothetical protein